MPVGDLSALNISKHGWFTVYENERLTYEKLNSLDKEILIQMLLSTKEQLDNALLKLDKMSKQINETNATIRILTEQLAIANQRQFGRKTEKDLVLDEEDGQQLFFNEVEFEFDKGIVEEPDIETVVRSYRRKKRVECTNLPFSMLFSSRRCTVSCPRIPCSRGRCSSTGCRLSRK